MTYGLLLWAGSRHSVSQFQGHGPAIQLGADTVVPCDYVRLFGVISSADLSLDRHASAVSATSFYWFRQLRRVRRSLGAESAATLVHAFVTSRVDYCNLLLAGRNKVVTDKLQRVMNAAARERHKEVRPRVSDSSIELRCTGSMWQIGSRSSPV